MIIGLRRGLLPVLFILMSLVLSMHQAQAAEHGLDASRHGVVDMAIHGQHDTDHPMHSTPCCAAAIVLTDPAIIAVSYSDPRAVFGLDAGRVPDYSRFVFEHFHPPRAA